MLSFSRKGITALGYLLLRSKRQETYWAVSFASITLSFRRPYQKDEAQPARLETCTARSSRGTQEATSKHLVAFLLLKLKLHNFLLQLQVDEKYL